MATLYVSGWLRQSFVFRPAQEAAGTLWKQEVATGGKRISRLTRRDVGFPGNRQPAATVANASLALQAGGRRFEPCTAHIALRESGNFVRCAASHHWRRGRVARARSILPALLQA